MIKIKGKVLEVSEKGEYQGSPYASIMLRSDEEGNGQILKYKINLNEVNYSDLAPLRDQECIVELALTKGQNSLATLKVVKLTQTKV